MRLSNATLTGASALLPRYDRGGLSGGIVHIGPGAFARSHLASYTDDVLNEDPRWAITAVSLNSSRTVGALAAQDGLYTLVEGERARIIGAIHRAVDASADRAAFFAAIADPATRVVTLTMTEKAYTGETPALLAAALLRRASQGGMPVSVLSLDNIPSNGWVLKRAVKDAAQNTDLIDEIAVFPSSMVDRITPATTPELRDVVEQKIGLEDAVPVAAEPFRQWVLEDSFAHARPPWDLAGVELVHDVAPYEEMKLRLLNGAHSTLAYLGQLRGHSTVGAAMSDQELVARLSQTAKEDVMPTLSLPLQTLQAYWQSLLTRFAAPGLAHRLDQIAMDGSQKMPIRIFAPLAELRAKGSAGAGLTRAVAAWIVWLDGLPDVAKDPRAAELQAGAGAGADERVAQICALPNLVPPSLQHDTEWRAELARAIAKHVLR